MGDIRTANAAILQQRPAVPKDLQQGALWAQQRLRIVFGIDEFQARGSDALATQDFITRLPLTIMMDDTGNKEKYAAFPGWGGLPDFSERVYHNKPRQLVYWPTGPDIAIYHKTDSQPVRWGIIVMQK